MIQRKLRMAAFLAFWLVGSTIPSTLIAQTAPSPEKAKIEALIDTVSELQDANFVRNGTEYDVNTAIRFLRGKWRANDSAVKTARDFIDKVASVSGTSGLPYHIRFKDGREMTSRNFLLAELHKLESS